MTQAKPVPYVAPTARSVPRPIPADFVRPPRYRYPSERASIPERCGHCGARLIRNDLPTSEHTLTDLNCVMCSRTACELQYDGVRQPYRERTITCICGAERSEYDRCGHCGRLRNPKRWSKDHDCCVDCGTTVGRPEGAGRCKACYSRRRHANGGAL